MQVEGNLEGLVGLEIHTLREVSYSQVWARRSDNPGVGLFDASKNAHESRFATAIGADETHALVIADTKGNVLKNGLDAVGFVNVMCSKHNKPVVLKTKTEGKPRLGVSPTDQCCRGMQSATGGRHCYQRVSALKNSFNYRLSVISYAPGNT